MGSFGVKVSADLADAMAGVDEVRSAADKQSQIGG
jgi:hypothetical protein